MKRLNKDEIKKQSLDSITICNAVEVEELNDRAERVQKSSGKWSNPGHLSKAQGKFFLSFLCTLFLHIFDT